MFETNNKNVESFLSSLENVAWLSQVGEPTNDDEKLIRLDLDFILNHHANFLIKNVGDAYEFWGDLLLKTEAKFERIIFDNSLLGEQTKINAFIDKLHIEFDDSFYLSLVEKFDSYYDDTCSYAHELLDPPLIKRFLRGAAAEILVSDFDSSLDLFQKLMPWLRQGHWTYGWRGEYPEGKLMLW